MAVSASFQWLGGWFSDSAGGCKELCCKFCSSLTSSVANVVHAVLKESRILSIPICHLCSQVFGALLLGLTLLFFVASHPKCSRCVIKLVHVQVGCCFFASSQILPGGGFNLSRKISVQGSSPSRWYCYCKVFKAGKCNMSQHTNLSCHLLWMANSESKEVWRVLKARATLSSPSTKRRSPLQRKRNRIKNQDVPFKK